VLKGGRKEFGGGKERKTGGGRGGEDGGGPQKHPSPFRFEWPLLFFFFAKTGGGSLPKIFRDPGWGEKKFFGGPRPVPGRVGGGLIY